MERALDEAGSIDVVVNNAFRPYSFDPQAPHLVRRHGVSRVRTGSLFSGGL
ncbi:hypothetical protein WKW77_29310 [Variovorax ureilyticus]|uniref:Short chain dehydrogenase n=1 Tax=Variovorax ureilyticus TaxID=1836198 RepID=A0ABU8VNV8_9BURK